MSKIITVIQLLNRTANGEEIPKTVKCNGKKYNYHDYSKNYYYIEDTEECLFDDNIAFLANDEVEILEDNTEEIEEKSNFEDMGYEIAQAYFEFYKGIAKALTEKKKESEDK